MEPVTHFLTGACIARAGLNRKAAYTTLAMTLAAEAPDLDVIWGRLGPVTGFEHHRGITHTFLAAPVIALAAVGLAWLIHRWRGKPATAAPIRWGLLWCFALIADLSHILLDFTNNYGVRPLFPFDAHWHAWSIVFIFDPWIFLALLSAVVFPWLFGLADTEIGARKKVFRGKGWSIAVLLFIALWWSLRNAEQLHAIALVRNAGTIQAPITRIAGEPYMLNPFTWHVLAETRDYYQTAEVHTLHDQIEARSPDGSDMIYKPPVTPAVAAAKQSYLGRVYLDWAMYPVATDLGNDPVPYDTAPQPQPGWHTVEFQDLRFGYPGFGLAGIGPGARGRSPLGAWVYVNQANQVEGMYMSGKEQK